MRTFGLVLTTVGFLWGSLVAILDPEHVPLAPFAGALGLAVVGVVVARFAARREAADETKLGASFDSLRAALDALVDEVGKLDDGKEGIDVYDLPDRVDAQVVPHLAAFVEAREAILHAHGSQAYADVMSPFAAGERTVNRVWSTAVDGYIDEAHASLALARTHLEAARDAFAQLPQSDGAGREAAAAATF
jgi:hypothetical protein